MPRVVTLLIAFFFTSCCIAQNKEIDSLHAAARNAQGISQVELYLSAAQAARNVQADTCIYFANKALALSARLKYSVGTIMGKIMTGRALATKGSFVIAQKFFADAEAEARKAGNDSLTSRALMGSANCNWHLGKHAEALEGNFAAMKISERLKLPADIASGKIGIAMVYQSQEKVELAEKYVLEALEFLNGRSLPVQRLNALHTLANIYGMQGKINQAMELDKEGIALAGVTGNEFAKSLFYDNMANCYLFGTPPDYPKSLHFFRQSLQIDSSFGNKKQMSDSYKNMGNVFMTQEKYAEAIPYLDRSIELARDAGFLQGEQESTLMLAALYKFSGNADAAYETLKKSGRLKDSLVNTAREAKIAELQTFYETDKQKQTIELQNAQLSRKNFILLATIITALLAALLGYSLYRRYKLKQQTRLQQAIMDQQQISTRAVIEAEERERQRIARDLHDGVGQMMSAAKMNLSAFEAELAKDRPEQRLSFEKIVGLVDESCKEIREVSHNMVPNALLKHSLAAAVGDFLDKLNGSSLKIHLYTEGLDQRLDSNVETVLYRVIQECVNNVIKHAHASSLDISIIRDKDGISATIEDNGTGFDSSVINQSEGIGLRNIYARVEYLKGTVDIDSAPGRGTMIGLHVPI